LGELYRIYYDEVFRYVYHRVATRVLAEDLVSETFVRALNRITTFMWQGRDPGAWFVTIARNLIADHYKCSRTRLEISAADLNISDTPAADLDPICTAASRTDAVVLSRITADTVTAAVATLTPLQQACIRLRFLHELNVADTAEAMGHNEGSVKTLQYRALRTLRRNPALLELKLADLS